MGVKPQGSIEEEPDFDMKEHDFLFSESSLYKFEKFLGEGSFGKVAQCLNTDTNKKMAVKIVRKDLAWAGSRELDMLAELKMLDQDKNNLVRFMEHFQHKGHVCVAFEMLDIDIFTYMEKRDFKPMHLSDIRSIAQQMLVALNALRSIGLVHADVKPENIMLVDQKVHPPRAKLIDFGLAWPVSELYCGCMIQVRGYRAPEVILGRPLNEAVDMWALGCVLAFMYLGRSMYPSQSDYDTMTFIVQMHGQPDNHLLESGIKTKEFFSKNQDSSWRLNTEDEYICATGGYTSSSRSSFHMCTSLDDIVKTRPESIKDGAGSKDRQAFSSLLKEMLNVDSEKRIIPSKALLHSFITRKHFSDYSKPSQMEESTNKVACGEKTCTRLDDPPSTDDKRTAGTNYKTPAAEANISSITGKKNKKAVHIHVRLESKTGLDDTKAAWTYTKSLGMNRAVIPNLDTSTNEGTTGIVEVKTRKKHFMRIYSFFSRTMKFIGCRGRVDVIE